MHRLTLNDLDGPVRQPIAACPVAAREIRRCRVQLERAADALARSAGTVNRLSEQGAGNAVLSRAAEILSRSYYLVDQVRDELDQEVL